MEPNKAAAKRFRLQEPDVCGLGKDFRVPEVASGTSRNCSGGLGVQQGAKALVVQRAVFG